MQGLDLLRSTRPRPPRTAGQHARGAARFLRLPDRHAERDLQPAQHHHGPDRRPDRRPARHAHVDARVRAHLPARRGDHRHVRVVRHDGPRASRLRARCRVDDRRRHRGSRPLVPRQAARLRLRSQPHVRPRRIVRRRSLADLGRRDLRLGVASGGAPRRRLLLRLVRRRRRLLGHRTQRRASLRSRATREVGRNPLGRPVEIRP